jgi:hypothetical protein
MSLINDALKRAGQKPASSPSPSELSAGLRPAEEAPARFPVLTLLIVLIPLIALGVWFLTKGLQLDEPPKPVAIEARVPETPSAPAIVAPTKPPAMAAPETLYKLQGIFWRPSNPSAVINGKTVYIGNRVENARVTAIDQESVTITVNGEAKVLSLP